jgi:uncharacterized protein YxjI
MIGKNRRQGRRDDRREDRQFGPVRGRGNNRYRMRQRLISIGDDFWIENDQGQKVFKVDGKALRIRKTLVFEDAQGRELCHIQERMLRVKETMEIEGPGGESIAMVKKALITPLRDRWVLKIRNGPDLEVQGNILNHEYKISQGRDKIAEVSKKWFRIADTYGVEIEPGQEDILILAATVAVDMMAHD